MAAKHCWLCVHCDLQEVSDMMNFVEEKSPVMHINVIAHQVCSVLKESYPEECDLCEDMVKEHICRHVVTPVASVTRITRDLLDMCETLRPTRESIEGADRARKRPRAAITDGTETATHRQTDDDGISLRACDERDSEGSVDTTGLYLRAVGQVMSIYRMHSKLMQPT